MSVHGLPQGMAFDKNEIKTNVRLCAQSTQKVSKHERTLSYLFCPWLFLSGESDVEMGEQAFHSMRFIMSTAFDQCEISWSITAF